MPSLLRPSLVTAALLLLALAIPARAQIVTVRVVEDGAPVEGALISLVDAQGTVVSRVLSNAEGHAVLRGGAGRFRIRAELIGRTSTDSELFDVPADGTVARTLVLDPRPVPLDAITVDVTSRCDARFDAGGAVAAVWNEARKALTAEQLGRASGLYRFDIEHFVRELDPTRRRVRSDDRRSVENISANPFRSLPAAELADQGYLRTTSGGDILYAPSPDVLLSDAFLDTHCFHVVHADDSGLVGLAFEPLPDRSVPDVSGVLWLRSSDAALRSLEFSYEALPARLPAGPYGGEATFAALPSGVWVVQSWRIRSPIVGVADMRFGNDRIADDERLLAVQEEGAEIVRIRERGGRLVTDVTRATLEGSIFDGDRDTPLADATVTLTGTEFRGTTDARGRFRIAGVPEGEYELTWTHPRLANSGYRPDAEDVRLRTGEVSRLELLLPSGAALQPTAADVARTDSVAEIARAIGRMNLVPISLRADSAADPAVVHGRVLDTGGRALESARVEIVEADIAATANGVGRFRISRVPSGRTILRTTMLGYATREDTVQLEPGSVVDVELRLATRPIELPPIAVEVRSRWLAVQGFYERRESGLSGHVISRADIERTQPMDLQTLLADVPGVRFHNLGPGRVSVRFNRMTMQPTRLDGCEPLIWLDGQRYLDKVSLSGPDDISHVENFNLISPEAVEAIEVYVGNPPLRFNHPCGVILIWTRRGGS